MKSAKKLKDKLYYFLAEKNWGVRREYVPYINSHKDVFEGHRIKRLWLLFKLNLHYRIFRSKNMMLSVPVPVSQQKSLVYPESLALRRPSPVQLAKQLLLYDVVSFDIFDTLIFRAFEWPTDLFYLIGEELKIENFKNLRQSKEREARETTGKPNREINIYDIYDLVCQSTSLDKEKGVKTELEIEKRFCFANPYMKQVFDILKMNGKKIVAMSDMYLPKPLMEELLASCGYKGFDNIIVSCDYLCGKYKGELQKYLKNVCYPDSKIIHVGDNFDADIKATKEAGIDAIHYPNVNVIGRQYRLKEMSRITGSMYKGLVNAYIHNGLMNKNKYWQHGFIYGGLLTYGYCQYIDKLVKEKKIDKIFFVARDGDIIHKVYKNYFDTVKSELILSSRMSLAFLTFDSYTEDFINRLLFSGAKSDEPQIVRKALEKIGLSVLLDLIENKEILDKPLTMDVCSYLRKEVYKNKKIISESLESRRCGAKEYFSELLEDAKNLLIIDVGWQGTSITQTADFIHRHVNPNINISGAMIGANNTGRADSLLFSDFIKCYVFSPVKNRDIMFEHNDPKTVVISNLIAEIIFSMTQPSFYSFDRTYGNYDLGFLLPENNDYQIVKDIHKGIFEFCEVYNSHIEKYIHTNISPVDAYLPLLKIGKKVDYVKKLFIDYKITSLVTREKIQTIGEIIK